MLKLGEKKILRCFQRAAKHAAGYRQLLTEAGIDAQEIASVADFVARCPLLEKSNTFRRFPISTLLADDIRQADIASFLTSSGHGANGYALGLSTREQLASLAGLIDLGLDMAFDVDRHRTLLINCLPMGVTFQSNAVCVANVSVREDMACAIVEQAGDLFDQIILCGDPLFLKRLCDYSQARGVDWKRHRMNVVIGEETFSESFRDYLAQTLGINLDDPVAGLIGSSMGVGELGLNLFTETRETIAIRRACDRSPELLAALCGSSACDAPLPTFLAFSPLRTFVEVVGPDASGAGDLVITVLDAKAPVPLMRYRTGDRATLLDHAKMMNAIRQHAPSLTAPTLPMIALHGRAKDALPGGWHVDMFKNALYREGAVARNLSGAFRLSLQNGRVLWETQMAIDATASCEEIVSALHRAIESTQPQRAAQLDVRCFLYREFPYGMSVDYERKFSYLAG